MQVGHANLGHPQLFVLCCQLYMLLNSSLVLAELPCHIATTTDSDSRPTQWKQSSKFAYSHFVVAEFLQPLGYSFFKVLSLRMSNKFLKIRPSECLDTPHTSN